MAGQDVPVDSAGGMKMIHDAAVLGSVAAQYYLGSHYEKSIPPEYDRARRYYRLCGAAGEPACQFKLAQMLLMRENRREHEYIQAIAWLQLASDQGFSQARDLLENEQPRLTAARVEWAKKLKPQLTKAR
jgi:TPR repeat protein